MMQLPSNRRVMWSTYLVSIGTYLLHLELPGAVTLRHLSTDLEKSQTNIIIITLKKVRSVFRETFRETLTVAEAVTDVLYKC